MTSWGTEGPFLVSKSQNHETTCSHSRVLLLAAGPLRLRAVGAARPFPELSDPVYQDFNEVFFSDVVVPLDHAEILGRLAQGNGPSYVAHLVKTRGVSFSSSAYFIEKVKLAGGDGVLVERLFASEASQQAHPLFGADPSYDHLAKCVELIHTGAIEPAEKECRASIGENPRSAWPLAATAKLLELQSSAQDSPETIKNKREEHTELLRRALALAPDVAFIHQNLASALPPAEAMKQLQQASALDTDALDYSEEDDSEFQSSLFSARPNDDGSEPPASSTEPTAINPELLRRIKIDSDFAKNHLALALEYFQVGNFENAEAELHEAVRLEPDNPVLHYHLAEFYLSRKNQESSLAELRESVRIVPFREWPHMMLAGALEQMGRTPEALKELQSFLAIRPTAVEPSNALIELYLAHKDRKSAIAELRRSLNATSPAFSNEAEFVEVRYQEEDRLANLLRENGELAASAEQYLYLLRFKPEDAGLHNDYGNVLLSEKHLDDAIAEYNESLRIDPTQATPHHNLALCLALKKNMDGAVTEFQQALDLNPKDARSLVFLGTALGVKGDLNGAKDMFQQALEKNPNDPTAHAQLGYVLMKFKDEFGALNELKRALELKADTAEAENNLAWLLATAEDHKLRNPEQALTLARSAVKDTAQPNAAYLDTLAEALLLNGQASEAFSTEQQALDLDPQNPEMQSRLAHFQEAAHEAALQADSKKP